jgi:hypothetical protein
MLTQEYLKHLFHYNPETGLFKRLVSPNRKTREVGKIASCINPTTGYVCIKINYKTYTAHRLAWLYMFGKFPDNCIDHINKIRHDNRIANLREATFAQNALNRNIQASSSSRFTNVTWCNRNKKWIVRGLIKGKRTYLGSFKCKIEANAHYVEIMKSHQKDNWLFAASTTKS